MELVQIEATKHTPKIVLDPESGVVEIRGKSYPENTFEFYRPLMEWLEEYFDQNAKDVTTFNIEITYFNSSTSKLLFDLFDLLDAQKEKHKIIINWIYDAENEHAQEAGEDFIEDFEDLDIKLIEKGEENS